jgi:hypothetical protein
MGIKTNRLVRVGWSCDKRPVLNEQKMKSAAPISIVVGGGVLIILLSESIHINK